VSSSGILWVKAFAVQIVAFPAAIVAAALLYSLGLPALDILIWGALLIIVCSIILSIHRSRSRGKPNHG
jgi:hypothetical protein